MLRLLSVLIYCQLAVSSYSLTQKVVNVEYPQTGSINLASGIDIPKINSGYTLWMPETSQIKGMVVFTHSRRDTVNKDELIEYALDNNLGVMYATTENRLEFLFENAKMDTLLGYVRSAMSRYNIPENALMYCGMSLEGTRALKLVLHGRSLPPELSIIPQAVAICDAPLDMIRFHGSMKKAFNLDYHTSASNEGKWVSSYLEQNLGGLPNKLKDKYLKYSPYVYNNNDPEKLISFQGISIRAYTEPDVNWWIDSRRKDYYDMNATDMAAWINDLKISGHNDAMLITTNEKGYLPNGSRHPHSWSIVDEKELIDWFVKLLNSN